MMRAAIKPFLSFSQISTYLRCRQEWRYVSPGESGTAGGRSAAVPRVGGST